MSDRQHNKKMFDYHTHNQQAAAGQAIINLPLDILLHPSEFVARAGAFYSVGVHPWWTLRNDIWQLLSAVEVLAQRPEVKVIGECGWDTLRGSSIGEVKAWDDAWTDMQTQSEVMWWHVRLSERLKKPLTVHCVRAWHLLLESKKLWRPTQQWTVHGFRGKEDLARQLVDAGIALSFGEHANLKAWEATPPEMRHVESDEGQLPLWLP